MIDVVKHLQKKHEIVYWTCPELEKEIDPTEFPGTVLHEHGDALAGIPARGFSMEDFPPPGEDLLSKLYATESVVLTMMNKRFEEKTVSERKHLYLQYVRYWTGILKKFKPDVLIFPTIPHTVYDFVVHDLGKIFRIKTIMMEPTWINDRMVIMTEYTEGSEELRRLAADYRNKEVSFGDLRTDLQEEYRLQTSTETDATPTFVKNITHRYRGTRLLAWKMQAVRNSLADLSVGKKAVSFLKRSFGENLKREYETVQRAPDLSKKFVYLPLHYQPERNSSPQGGVYVDQILMVETVSAALPDGWFLYVKEHPTQWLYRGTTYFSYRFRGYYRALAQLKNVILVPIDTNTYTLTKQAYAVATITGTAGWEALSRSRPVLVFGYPWYRDCPGVLRVYDLSSCQDALKKIARGFAPTQEDILRYLLALDRGSFHGYIDRDGQNISRLSRAENSVNIARAISGMLGPA